MVLVPSSQKAVPTAYTSKGDWDSYFEGYRPTVVGDVFLAEVFRSCLKPDAKKTVLEIGCAGGEYLCYLSKTFGFQPFGVDFSDEIRKTAELFEFNGLPRPTLYQHDFFNWNPGRVFDVVCSFGFIEHFEDPALVIRKHAALLAPGGTLIITLPHFAHVQYLFHWLIDRENLRKHNTRIMRLPVLRRAMLGLPLRIEQLDYYQTFGFWTERKSWNAWQKCIRWQIEMCGKVVHKLLGFSRPNFLFSPHIVLVATRIPVA